MEMERLITLLIFLAVAGVIIYVVAALSGIGSSAIISPTEILPTYLT